MEEKELRRDNKFLCKEFCHELAEFFAISEFYSKERKEGEEF